MAPRNQGSSSTCCTAVGGIAQILLGILSIALGAVVISSGPLGDVYQIYIPLWAGSVFLIAGIFGALITCCDLSSRNCLAGWYITFSVIAIFVAFAEASWEGYLTFAFELVSSYYCVILNVANLETEGVADVFADALNVGCDDFNLVYHMHIALTAVAGIEFIVAIIGSISGCAICCCGAQPQDTQTDNLIIVTGQSMQPIADDGYPQAINALPYAQIPPPPYRPTHTTISYAPSPSVNYVVLQ